MNALYNALHRVESHLNFQTFDAYVLSMIRILHTYTYKYIYIYIQKAASVILLAVRDFNIVLPTKPRPWWEAFIGNKVDKANELVDAANAILGTCTLYLGMENGLSVSEQK